MPMSRGDRLEVLTPAHRVRYDAPSQLHAHVRTYNTEFTMSMSFARYVATVMGMSGGNGGLHIPNG